MSFGFGFGFPSWRTLAGGFSPAALFVGGVQGVLFDISDLTTLFTTSAGTTQCAMPGQGSAVSVGLMLDKSQGLVLGPELAGSILGGTSGWTFVGAATVSGGAIVFTTPPSTNASAQYNPIVSSGLWYRVQITLTGTGQVTVQLGSAGTSATFTAPGSYSFTGIASGGTPTVLTFSSVLSGVNNFVGSVTAVSVRTLPGNHAIAANDSTARPELRARVNLLTYSEEFDNAAWTKYSVAVDANATTDPLGGNTADRLKSNSTTNSLLLQQAILNLASGASYTRSVYAKADAISTLTMQIGGTTEGNIFVQANLLNGTATSGGVVEDAGNGWWKISRTFTMSGTTNDFYFVLPTGTPIGNGVFLWGADLRPANIGANVPAYQRIADANTYDTSGFPLYLRFDGIDDRMLTASNFPFTGDPTFTCFWSQNRQTTSSVGTFGWGSTGAALAAAGHFYVSGANGSFAYAGANGFNFATDNANEPAVYSYAKTPGAINTTSSARRNGANNNGVGSSSNTPNISSLPLYIGAWGNLASNYFNGDIYSLIIAGSAVSAGNISATEQWVAGKTGIVIP